MVPSFKVNTSDFSPFRPYINVMVYIAASSSHTAVKVMSEVTFTLSPAAYTAASFFHPVNTCPSHGSSIDGSVNSEFSATYSVRA